MATLTQEQTDFLKSHHIPMDKTFDASGLSSKEYKAKMKENGALVAYGVPPCPKGHTLKNKQANCLQCNPQAIASIKGKPKPSSRDTNTNPRAPATIPGKSVCGT